MEKSDLGLMIGLHKNAFLPMNIFEDGLGLTNRNFSFMVVLSSFLTPIVKLKITLIKQIKKIIVQTIFPGVGGILFQSGKRW
jgi:hypothetical protein